MHSVHMSNIMGSYRIYRNQEYIVLLGEKLWIFHIDGSCVACRDGFYNATKLVFLSGGRILICGGKNTMYRLISLRDGNDIWQIKENKKVTVTSNRFAVAPDESYALDYYLWKDTNYLVRIDLLSGVASNHHLHEGFRALVDIVFDSKGSVYLLQTQYDDLGEERVSRNEIRVLDNKYSSRQKLEFSFQAPSIAAFFWDHEKIITNDLNVYNLRTGNCDFKLSGNLNYQVYGFGPNDIWFDYSGQYLCVMFDHANIVVDCNTGCTVGLYAGEFAHGCLINGEYWISSNAGIRILPFPCIEDLSAQRQVKRILS